MSRCCASAKKLKATVVRLLQQIKAAVVPPRQQPRVSHFNPSAWFLDNKGLENLKDSYNFVLTG